MDRRGELTDDDRRVAAERSGPARGDRLRHLDLLRRPARPARRAPRARLHRDRVLRRDRRRPRRRGLGRARARARRARRRRRRSRWPRRSASASATRRPPSATATSIDAGPGAVERVLAARDAARARAARPQRARRARADEARRLVGPAPRARRLARRRCSTRSRRPTCAAAAAPASRPARSGSSPPRGEADEKFVVANGDEGDPGSYIDKLPDGATTRRSCSRAWRSPATRSAPRTASSYALGVPALQAGARRRDRARPRAGAARRRHPRQRLRLRRLGRRGRRLLRRRRGDGAAVVPQGPARDGLRAPAVPGRARRASACRRSSTTSRRSATSRSSRATAPPPTARSSAEARPRARSSSASTSASRARACTRCRSALTMRELCEEVARRPARRPRDQGACRSAARSAASCPASRLDTPFDFEALAAEGCMVGHGGIVAFDDTHRHARRRRAPAALRRARELRQVLPVPDRPAPGARDVRRTAAPRRARVLLEELLETLELRLAVRARRRHAGADPQPARALPRRAGAGRVMHASRSTAPTVDVPRRARRCSSAAQLGGRGASRRSASTSGRRRSAPAASASSASRARRARSRRARRPCRDGMAIDTTTTDRAPRRRDRRRARALRAARARRAGTPSSRASPRTLGVGEPRWPGERHDRRHDTAHPYLAFRHELCISCGRCVRACDEVQGTFALTATGRGFDANVAAGLDGGFRDSSVRLVRRVRRHVPDRRDHRDDAPEPDRAEPAR